jgi:hypothetical protein
MDFLGEKLAFPFAMGEKDEIFEVENDSSEISK